MGHEWLKVCRRCHAVVTGLQFGLYELVAFGINGMKRHVVEVQGPTLVGERLVRVVGQGVVHLAHTRSDIVLAHFPMNRDRGLRGT